MPRLAIALPRRPDAQTDARGVLQSVNDRKQVAGIRVAARPEHPHQAFCRCPCVLGEFVEADRRVDVVAQHRLAGFDIAREKAINSLAQ